MNHHQEVNVAKGEGDIVVVYPQALVAASEFR